MKNGFYTVVFASSVGLGGTGVVNVIDDRVTGGDSGYFYLGTANDNGGIAQVSLTIQRYNKMIPSVFGDMECFELDLEGEIRDGHGEMKGSVRGFPDARLAVKFSKVA